MRWSREEDQAFLRTLPPDAPAISQCPELWPECAIYMQAFRELSVSRPIGFGAIGYIPAAEVDAWARIYAIEDTETLWRHVHAVDMAYVKEWRDRQERERERPDQPVDQRNPAARPGRA